MKPSVHGIAIVGGLVGAAAIGAGVGSATYAMLSDNQTNVLSIRRIYDETYQGVVEIRATTITKPPLPEEKQQAQGSGWMYDDRGDIVTNQHVVEESDSLSVRLWNGSVYPATIVGSDSSADLAVIKIDAPSTLLHPLSVGNSDALHVGDQLVAIGNPFGLINTTTSGIVSALHRTFTALNEHKVSDAIQTDAAINGGSSGSPLLNGNGKVVGVAAKIQSESGGNDGIAFAISSHTVASVVSGLIFNGKTAHG